MPDGPALRGPVFGSRCNGQQRTLRRRDPKRFQCRRTVLVRNDQAWRWDNVPALDQSDKALNLRQEGFRDGPGQQQTTQGTTIPAPGRDAGPKWDERRFERSRQYEGEIIAPRPQVAANTPAYGPAKLAVPERQRHGLADLGHEAQQRQGPGRRQNVDSRVGIATLQNLEQAVSHHHVADPCRSDDEHALRTKVEAHRLGLSIPGTLGEQEKTTEGKEGSAQR